MCPWRQVVGAQGPHLPARPVVSSGDPTPGQAFVPSRHLSFSPWPSSCHLQISRFPIPSTRASPRRSDCACPFPKDLASATPAINVSFLSCLPMPRSVDTGPSEARTQDEPARRRVTSRTRASPPLPGMTGSQGRIRRVTPVPGMGTGSQGPWLSENSARRGQAHSVGYAFRGKRHVFVFLSLA